MQVDRLDANMELVVLREPQVQLEGVILPICGRDLYPSAPVELFSLSR